jgi:hypothetical protein
VGRLAITGPIAVALAGCELVFPLDGASEPPPPSRCFGDDFDAPVLDAWWRVMDPASPHQVVNAANELVIDFAPSVDSYNGVESTELHRIEDARITVFLLEPGAVDGFVETTLEVQSGAGDVFRIAVGAGQIGFDGTVAGEPQRVLAPYVPSEFRYWAIRHEPGAVVFDTMDDLAVDWTERHRVMVDDPAPARIRLYGGTFMGGRADPGTIRFDDFLYDLQVCP